ncbi:MAG: metallophosphoesterase family protein [Nanoarchaeota archaeon]|nr:metallophosphoesterase family protein [Nanoarchaeota archaeon]MBU4242180.1 metallophosphoesterase family protein [Nanoarchaeota archaeon]MBU4352173.1 metallophosphoesterase family protein [Nanoarchaeota archaeon]
MKILAVGDIHGDRDLARELAERADLEQVDLVVICGDITQNEESTDNLIGIFKQKVLLVHGNHESLATADFLAELYDGKNLHGYAMNLQDIAFFGCGSANIGLFQLSEDEIFKTLKKGFNYSKAAKKKIMITHVHPSKTLMENFSKFVPGSSGVKKAVDEFQPDILFCSHVHEAEGIEEKIGKTTVINVGRKGKIIEI